tara:strand:+ start:635 stop:907 length:273 start_codon:yes stop_codon:yes gene_type:complete
LNRSYRLTNEDIIFLINEIVKDSLLKTKLKEKSCLNEDDLIELWDLCTDAVCLEFDENYEPTQKGLFIEDLIDKFYELGENYDPEKQYKK